MEINISCRPGTVVCDHLFDMVWIDSSGSVEKDCSYLYGRYSDVLAAAIKHAPRFDEGVARVTRTGYLTSNLTFNFLKNLCHKNEISLRRTDKFSDLLEIYKMVKCYDIAGTVSETVLRALVSKLDASNTVHLLHDLADALFCTDLQTQAQRFFYLFPIDCLTKAKNIDDTILSLCCGNDLNTSEEALMTILVEKNQIAAISSVVRCSELSFDYLMRFRSQHPNSFTDEWYMTVLSNIHTNTESKVAARTKKHLYGCYPHYLKLKTEVEITLQSVGYTVVFYTVAVQKHTTILVPNFNTCAGVISLQTEMTSTHIGIRGSFNNGLSSSGSAEGTKSSGAVHVECRVLNYLKNTNKTHSVDSGRTFHLERILTLNTLSTEGYCFSKRHFPEMVAGSDLLIRINISKE